MKEIVKKYNIKNILDVGSLDVNGSYRDLFENYTGLDIEEGKNVDVIGEEYNYPFSNDSFDVVICGQTLEHTEELLKVVKEMARVAKDMVVVIVPNAAPEHRYPKDYWRILPDGLEFLFKKAGLEVLECYMSFNDTVGIAKKV